ncbi:Peroxiredoxin [Ignavibacterium album JCM 16511]|uniref:Peroxiredoxin n=1 Tax=Ignavibacterium album (strain DSM 19864 / JCM 16511 / NBRC 101810 / Mat9-16) TaxID=945713 RepID=I0AJC2_IGNAJ|nr:peroxiredoxin family protein [Ignavibacterium album]AFH49079.1 Peroxiredoxin [Ignavibacterium album JCM 16511]
MTVGEIAPDFTLPDQYGNDYNLYKNLLLIFYPKDNTPVCSTQFKDYQINIEKFVEFNIQPVAINIADVDSHKSFCEELNVNFPVLSDKEKKVSELYDAINFLGMNKRMIILVGKNRKIKMIKKMLPINYISTDELIKEIISLRIN